MRSQAGLSRLIACWVALIAPRKNIVEQLRQAIADSGQTEYAIAKGAAVSQSVVNRFAHGERGISFETAVKLCAYLELALHPRRCRGGGVKSAFRTKAPAWLQTSSSFLSGRSALKSSAGWNCNHCVTIWTLKTRESKSGGLAMPWLQW